MSDLHALHREVGINITDQQLRNYSESVKSLPIAEGQLASIIKTTIYGEKINSTRVRRAS